MKMLLGLMLLVPALAQAGGGWISSGGEVFREAKNPWFVRNTPTVNYCVDIDAASVSASAATVRSLIRQAIGYWQGEFARSMLVDTHGSFVVGTQTFSEIDCSLGVADINFRIGYGSLKADELAFLADVERYVGVSVRTDYDRVNLRGKGFVFISSDQGPHAYHNAGQLVENAWGNDRLLLYALMHEMGHVFGLPHTGYALMSEVFLEQMLNKNIAPIFLSHPIEAFFAPSADLPGGELSGDAKQWFGISLDYQAISLGMSHGFLEFPVLAKKEGSDQWDEVGTVKNVTLSLFDLRNRPAIFLQLTPEQTVFTEQEAAFRPFMIAGQFVDFGAEATYVANSDHLPRSTYLRVTSNSVALMGQHAGKVKPMFSYSSVIGAALLYVPQP